MSRASINWGVLGAAEIAREQTIPAILAAENSRLYALASRRGVPGELVEHFGCETGYGDYDEVLADPAVDAVYLPLPNDRHADVLGYDSGMDAAARHAYEVYGTAGPTLRYKCCFAAIRRCSTQGDCAARATPCLAAKQRLARTRMKPQHALRPSCRRMTATARSRSWTPRARSSIERVTSFQYPNGIAQFADCVLDAHVPDYAPENMFANRP